MTPEQEARVTELTRLLNSEKHAHNPGRALWESERYSLVANSAGQQGNYVAYASARDAQKASVLQEAISEIDQELASLDGNKDAESRVGILRGDRQRYIDSLAALRLTVNVPQIAKDMGVTAPVRQDEGTVPDGFDFTVPEKYNAGDAVQLSGGEAATVLATAASLPGISAGDVIEHAIASEDTEPQSTIAETEMAKQDAVPEVIDVEHAAATGIALPYEPGEEPTTLETVSPAAVASTETPADTIIADDPNDDDIPF